MIEGDSTLVKLNSQKYKIRMYFFQLLEIFRTPPKDSGR